MVTRKPKHLFLLCLIIVQSLSDVTGWSSVPVYLACMPRTWSLAAAKEHIDPEPLSLTVSYEGSTTKIPIQPNETILAALEANRRDNLVLADLELPSDCRRGNCLTCAASHRKTSQIRNVICGDGLAPAISQQLRDRGYVLTCSARVHGPGVHLQLDQHAYAWQDMYANRLEEEETQHEARKAMAQVMREFAETHVEEWTEETEHIYIKSPDE